MLKRIADVCYRRRWRVLIGWIVLLVGINIVGGAAGAKYSQSFNLPQTDSQKAFDLLDSRFPARAGETAQRPAAAIVAPISLRASCDCRRKFSTLSV